MELNVQRIKDMGVLGLMQWYALIRPQLLGTCFSELCHSVFNLFQSCPRSLGSMPVVQAEILSAHSNVLFLFYSSPPKRVQGRK